MEQPDSQTNNETQREILNEAQRQEQIRRNQAALAMLDEWDREDPVEQRTTWEFLERALKEDPITFRAPSL